MDVETEALEGAHTWYICSLPPGKTNIGCNWIYKVKHNVDGSIEKYKVRLVAKGYTQPEGIDYNEYFSPMAKLTSVSCLPFLLSRDSPLLSCKFPMLFSMESLNEETYMQLPPEDAAKQGDSLPPNVVCKLEKSHYGLKHASRQWFFFFFLPLSLVWFLLNLQLITLVS